MRLLLLLLGVQAGLGYHVLFYHTLGTRSHLLQYKPLVAELLTRGHKVTSVFFAEVGLKHENYTEIVVPNLMSAMEKEMSKMIMKEGGQNWMNPELWRWAINMWSESLEGITLQPLREERVRGLLDSGKKVDVMITMLHMLSGFMLDILDCPMVLFSPVGPIPFSMAGTGNTINLSIQGTLQGRHIEPLSFLQRVENHMLSMAQNLFISWMQSRSTALLQAELGTQVRSVEEIVEARFSLLIGASHPVTHGAWPYLPNVIQVGGLHLRDPEPLPADLLQWMDAAHQGVVYVSFGSAFKPSQMSTEKMEIFLETFRRLDMAVVWKWDGEVDNLPSNVLVSTWLPQQDLLGHPNLKVFVTHGGLGSLTEAIYHKAVIVGIPFSNDQKPNLLRASRLGYAAMLDWDKLTVEDFHGAVEAGGRDEERRAALERVHSLYLDREQSPAQSAAWWVEYACRHGGAAVLGNPHLEAAPWYQRHHIDLVLAVTTALALILILSLAACTACWRCCCSRAKKTKTE